MNKYEEAAIQGRACEIYFRFGLLKTPENGRDIDLKYYSMPVEQVKQCCYQCIEAITEEVDEPFKKDFWFKVQNFIMFKL